MWKKDHLPHIFTYSETVSAASSKTSSAQAKMERCALSDAKLSAQTKPDRSMLLTVVLPLLQRLIVTDHDWWSSFRIQCCHSRHITMTVHHCPMIWHQLRTEKVLHPWPKRNDVLWFCIKSGILPTQMSIFNKHGIDLKSRNMNPIPDPIPGWFTIRISLFPSWCQKPDASIWDDSPSLQGLRRASSVLIKHGNMAIQHPLYPLAMTNIAIENGPNRNSWFTHETWWFSIVYPLNMVIFQSWFNELKGGHFPWQTVNFSIALVKTATSPSARSPGPAKGWGKCPRKMLETLKHAESTEKWWGIYMEMSLGKHHIWELMWCR